MNDFHNRSSGLKIYLIKYGRLKQLPKIKQKLNKNLLSIDNGEFFNVEVLLLKIINY